MRIVFMGTPDFAVPSLKALIESGREVVGVFTQPDRPVGRGGKLAMPPVKELALQHDIPVFQFEKARVKAGRETLESLKPDLVVTAAFGQILSQRMLDVPPKGTINVHASLLPLYRGSSPVQWSVIDGQEKTGVTIMYTVKEVDAGDMILQVETPIGEKETAGELMDRLAQIGAEALLQAIEKIEQDTVQAVRQDETKVSHCAMLDKEMGRIDWTMPARRIDHLVRGVSPWPGAFTTWDDQILKIWRVTPMEGEGKPGKVQADPKEGLVVFCGQGALRIEEVQAAGKKRMEATAFLRGLRTPVPNFVGEEHDE